MFSTDERVQRTPTELEKDYSDYTHTREGVWSQSTTNSRQEIGKIKSSRIIPENKSEPRPFVHVAIV